MTLRRLVGFAVHVQVVSGDESSGVHSSTWFGVKTFPVWDSALQPPPSPITFLYPPCLHPISAWMVCIPKKYIHFFFEATAINSRGENRRVAAVHATKTNPGSGQFGLPFPCAAQWPMTVPHGSIGNTAIQITLNNYEMSWLRAAIRVTHQRHLVL